MHRIIFQKQLASLSIDEPRKTEVFDLSRATSLVFVVVTSNFVDYVAADIELQASLDGVNWFVIQSIEVLETDTLKKLETTQALYRFYRLSYGHNAGSYTVTTRLIAKG